MDACLPYVPSHILLFPLVLRTLTITRTDSNILRLRHFNSSTGTMGEIITELSITNPSQPSTSTDNTLAYRPNFADYHQSGLAGVFLNLENLFPCASMDDKYPLCSTFTFEEDGFRDGKAIIETEDIGNNLRVFSSTENIKTYGFAFQGCCQLNGLDGCMPIYFDMAITCQLARSACEL